MYFFRNYIAKGISVRGASGVPGLIVTSEFGFMLLLFPLELLFPLSSQKNAPDGVKKCPSHLA